MTERDDIERERDRDINSGRDTEKDKGREKQREPEGIRQNAPVCQCRPMLPVLPSVPNAFMCLPVLPVPLSASQWSFSSAGL